MISHTSGADDEGEKEIKKAAEFIVLSARSIMVNSFLDGSSSPSSIRLFLHPLPPICLILHNLLAVTEGLIIKKCGKAVIMKGLIAP